MSVWIESEDGTIDGRGAMTKLWGGICMAPGVKDFADKHKAHWLVTDIAAYGGSLQAPFQFWNITVREGIGKLVCVEDEGLEPVWMIERIITDLADGSYDLWLVKSPEVITILLPEEY